jgi:thiol-disulfide isomerase/thioredoxin
MNRFRITMLGAAVLGVAAIVAPANAQDASSDARQADEIMAEINGATAPRLTARRGDDGYAEALQQYRKDYNAWTKARAALILELYETQPDHAEVPKLMTQRWQMLARQPGGAEAVLRETGEIMKSGDGPFAIDACYTYAQTIGVKSDYSEDEFEPALAHFIKMAPDDDRPAGLLMSAARSMKDPERQLATYRRVLRDYPDARATRYTAGKIKQVEGMNRPFKLEFNDAIGGETISMKKLRGKVVVIDFWATWCGPCVAEMPHMKELYAAYADKGVEFVGISLDQPEDKGGLEKLRKYCDENNISWPQYYQGNYWQSEFSTGWGINSIPTMFVVDQKGNLHSVKARGKLDEMLPKMLGIEKLTKKGDG